MDRSIARSPRERPAQAPRQTGSGAYRLGAVLSRSPSATVYLARAVAGGETAVVKQPASAGAAAHEAAVLRHLRGQAAPALLARDDIAGHPALVMERLTGRSLADLVREDAAVPRSGRFRKVLDGLAEALAGLHARGVVHGDLKPDHVIVEPDDSVRLIDFSASSLEARPPPGPTDTAWLTPGFAAPEQYAAGGPPDARSDLYAFGAVAFWAATGHVPPPDGAADTRSHEEALRRARLPEDLRLPVLACLRPKPEDRPRDAAGLRDLLAGRGTRTPAPAPMAQAPTMNRRPDDVPPTVRVRRRRIVAPQRDDTAGGDREPPKRRNLGRLFLWLFMLALAAGLATLGVRQGKPLYEKHFKTTWLVDPNGAGDAASLVEAVARAGREATFLLAPGEHPGALLQDGRYRIQPAQDDAAPPVILAGPAGCLSAVNTRLTLVELVFRGTGGEAGRACIEQTGGALTLRASVMEGLSGPAILARGSASLQVAESELVAIGGDAIRVEGGSELALLDTTLDRAGGNAVAAGSGALLTLRGNRILAAGGNGVLLTEGARARLEGDLIRGSGASALEAASGARAELRDVTLAASAGAGLFLHGASRLRMTDSRVTDNGLSGLFADGAAEIALTGNSVADNAEHGVLLLGARSGRLARNDIARNAGYGLVLDPATRIEVGDNALDSNEAGALLDARDGGDRTAEDGAAEEGAE